MHLLLLISDISEVQYYGRDLRCVKFRRLALCIVHYDINVHWP